MNDNYIVAVYVIVDYFLRAMHYRDDVRSTISAAEIITVAIVATKHFQNHHEQTVPLMVRLGYIRLINLSRFNHRLHALADWLLTVSQAISELFATSDLLIVDVMPVPVCKRVHVGTLQKGARKSVSWLLCRQERVLLGWQLHLICVTCGIPVAYALLPARWDELVHIQSLLAVLSEGSRVVADKGLLWLSPTSFFSNQGITM